MARPALLPVADALARLLDGKTPLGAETLDLKNALGRVLATDIAAQRTQPPFPASAMDGYAVRQGDLENGTPLTLIGMAAAGHPFAGTVGKGEAVRIFTGGVVPEGADTILIQEDTTADETTITPTAIPDKGVFVRKAGLDFHQGDTLLAKGTVLTPEALALVAAANHGAVNVYRKPRIGLLATGDELRLPGEETQPGEIIASNSFGLAALCAQLGAEPVDLGIARDNEASLKACIHEAVDAQCDVLVTMGGASVGDHDLVQPVLTSMGMALEFWKIAMRPGKPLMTGSLGNMTVLGLPGNPVSAMVCGHVFLAPLIKVLTGRAPKPEIITATLSHPLTANGPREHYMRGVMRISDDGERLVQVFDNQDSSVVSLLAKANCLVVRPVGDGALEAGAQVKVMMI